MLGHSGHLAGREHEHGEYLDYHHDHLIIIGTSCLCQIISPDGHFFTMEAKLNLCHLPSTEDGFDQDTFEDDELCQDTVLRYT